MRLDFPTNGWGIAGYKTVNAYDCRQFILCYRYYLYARGSLDIRPLYKLRCDLYDACGHCHLVVDH